MSRENKKQAAKAFDQFYTQDAVADRCVKCTLQILKKLKYDTEKVVFLEPSAGNGSFMRALKRNAAKKAIAYDIDPKASYIAKRNFLVDDLPEIHRIKSTVIAIGNPPFGKRAKDAIAFMNRAFDYSEVVSFILPLQFHKFSAQKQIRNDAKLIYDATLDESSFLLNGKPYSVRCCLQVWTTKNSRIKNLRILSPPATKHPDFKMWQYNNTREAEKYFDKEKYGWDFAVPRQGYKNYSDRVVSPEKMDRRTKWIFFKAKDAETRKRLNAINFEELSRKNISIPGFGKADVVAEYRRLYE